MNVRNPLTGMLALAILLIAGMIPTAAVQDTTYLDVGAGDEFVICLDSNPSTGYGWMADFDPDVLSLVKKTFESSRHPPGMVGVGGRELFTFAALEAGDTKLYMIYLQPWAGGSIAETRDFSIRVADENMTHIDATVGDDFEISLEDNSASTGYTWTAKFNESALNLINETFEPCLLDTDIMGIGGWRTFEFSPLMAGDTNISMTLEKPDHSVAKEWIFWVLAR
ncbi:MAG: protease inhibitor I42 family protein [Euryarchaeota archaeon]|nr:protease inhibitor I42 family protein [Euryarchaeota archaeon]